MTILDVTQMYGVCDGRRSFGCGLTAAQHWKGVIDPFGVVHYTARRFTRRALRNLLLLVARRDREDPTSGWLNDYSRYGYLYLYLDNVKASRMALDLGIRLPARLSRLDRLKCRRLAKRQGVKLSKRSAVYRWANDV